MLILLYSGSKTKMRPITRSQTQQKRKESNKKNAEYFAQHFSSNEIEGDYECDCKRHGNSMCCDYKGCKRWYCEKYLIKVLQYTRNEMKIFFHKKIIVTYIIVQK